MRFVFLALLISGCHVKSPWNCEKEGETREGYRRVCGQTGVKGFCIEFVPSWYKEVCIDGHWEEIK